MGFFSRRQPPVDDRWEALNAEYQNYRRRTALELETAEAKATRQTVAAFLGLYDDLSRALDCPCGDPAFYKGVELIYKSLLDTLSSLGVKPMDSLGRMFNPTYHEAVEQIVDPRYRRDGYPRRIDGSVFDLIQLILVGPEFRLLGADFPAE